MEVLVIGWGMVGNELINYLYDRNHNVSVISRTDKGLFENIPKYFLDITNENKLYETIKNIKPEVVINTAAFTNVDLCEKERDIAYNINALGARYVGNVCKKLDIPLYHISTDYIFDGKKGNYSEYDMANPINHYGYTKYMGEKHLLDLNYNKLSIVRISVPYGFSPIKNNFFTWVLNSLEENKEINIITDQWNTPTYLGELSSLLENMIDNNLFGIYHLGGGEKVSRYDFAIKIAKIFNLDENLINPVKSSSLNWVAKRPTDTSLNCNKLENNLNIKLKSLNDCLNELKRSLDKIN